VLVLPSPKSHDQEVGLLVVWSVKFTVRGTGPLVGVPVKLVTGREHVGVLTVGPLLEPCAGNLEEPPLPSAKEK
jgi:hypothetical protein